MKAIKNKLIRELETLDAKAARHDGEVTQKWIEEVHLVAEALCYLEKAEKIIHGHPMMDMPMPMPMPNMPDNIEPEEKKHIFKNA